MKATQFLFYFFFAITFIFTGCGDDTDVTPSCTDGIQNGSETGIDCGGIDCPACVSICSPCPTVTDIDGNVYEVISIGSQTWMKENLKTSKYNDGTSIPTGLSNEEWLNATTDAYAIYDNNAANNTTYGKLYNWFAVNTDKLCPEGWHIPSKAEWEVLVDFLGGEGVAGGKMKSTGISLWTTPNEGATNSSGFTALPSGYRINGYAGAGTTTNWWSATEASIDAAWMLGSLYYLNSQASIFNNGKISGYPCRCLKD
jgi:uncharacterized protein (TIGR02145 family)